MPNKTKSNTGSTYKFNPFKSRAVESPRRIPTSINPHSSVTDKKGLRLLVDKSPFPRWIFDTETLAFLEVNDAAIQDYGYSVEEFLKMKVTDVLTTEDKPLLLEYLANLTADRKLSGTWRHRRKDGTVLYVEIASQRFIFKGKPVCSNMVYDISGRKPLEAKLNLYREIVKTIPIGLAIVSRGTAKDPGAFKIVESNPAVQRITHSDPEVFLDKLLRESFPHVINSGSRDTFADILRSRESRDLGEIRHRNSHTPDEIFAVKAFPLSPGHLGIAFENITERKKAEEALIQSNQQYMMLFNNNPLPMFVFDLNSLAILAVNEAAIKQYGYTQEEFFSLTVKDIRPARDVPAFLDELPELISGKIFSGFVRHRKKDGTVILAEVTRYTSTFSGKLVGHTVVKDITGLKKMEAELTASQAESLRLVADLHSAREAERIHLARDVHDELGQVLSAVKMGLSLLIRSLGKDEKPMPRSSIVEELMALTTAVDQTAASIRMVLAKLRPEILDELGLKAAIKWQMQEFEQRSSIECELDISDGEIVLDPDREAAVFRILQEALTNISRHSGASKVHVSVANDQNNILLIIRDNGRGIAETEISKPKSHGLRSIRERVRFLGATMRISGDTHKGTIICLDIPARAETLVVTP